MTTIVNPHRAPLGREPDFVGVVRLRPEPLGQHYRAEAWRLSDGQLVVIVSDNGGTSLLIASELIAKAVDQQWPGDKGCAVIIEDWSEDRKFLDEHRFMQSSRNGGHWVVDLDKWAERGLCLPA